MTSEGIRKQVSPMVIWMADAAVRQARRAITNKTLFRSVLNPYNRPEVDTAAEVLFCMFNTCTADIKGALLAMPEQLDGFVSVPGINYLDCFAECLAEQLLVYPEPKALELREADWVLNLLG